MGPSTACPSCGFENPRAWQHCASCGSPLGSNPRRTGVTVLSDQTMVSSAPSPESITQDVVSDPEELAELESISVEVEEDDLDQTIAEDAAPPNEGEGHVPLIGQTEAAAAIQAGVERAFTVGAPTLVALEGPRGSGKTRLLIHASEIAARQNPQVRVLYAACREGGDGSYAPFSRMLLERFGVTPSSSPSAVRAQMSTTVSGALQTADVISVGETTHLLGHIAGIPFPDSPFLTPLKKNPTELHKRACAAVRRLLEGDAQQRPVLVLLDNMQSAEPEAWDIIEALVQAEAHIAIVVAGDTGMSERAEKLEPSGGIAFGPVAPLDEADVQSMLHVLLPTLTSAPEPLVAAVTHRTGGLPSAVRELVFALWESGLFVQSPDGLGVDLERLEGGDLPITMEDAIQARLGRLDALERATLQRASIMGEVFWDAALLGMMRSERPAPGDHGDPLSVWPDDADAKALDGALLRLQEKGFIHLHEQSDMPGAHEYGFALAGTRRHVYDALDEDTRTARHSAVARWLSLIAETRREGVASMIAPHLERAGETVRAARAYQEAAAYERAYLRTHRALRYIEKALEHLPKEDVVRRIGALHMHGSLLSTLGRFEEAIESFTIMLGLAWNIGARGKGGAALNRIARAHRARGEIDAASKHLERALELFRAAADLRGVAATLDDLAQIGLLRGDVEAAVQMGSEALEIRRAHADERGEAVSMTTLGSLELHRGNLDAAAELFEGALAIRQRVGDHAGVVRSLNALGVVAFERGEAEAAIQSWESALDRAREMADRGSECFLLNNVGEAKLVAGAYDEAAETLDRAHTLALEIGDRRARADIVRNRGLLALRRGDDDASERIRSALEVAQEYGAPEAVALAHRALGSLRAQTLFASDTESTEGTAEESFLASIDLFREIGNEREAARSLVELARYHIERGDAETAKERLREARAIFRRIGLPDAQKVDATLAELG